VLEAGGTRLLVPVALGVSGALLVVSWIVGQAFGV
jgi:hypothetical protein